MGLLWIFGGFTVDFCGFTVGMGFRWRVWWSVEDVGMAGLVVGELR